MRRELSLAQRVVVATRRLAAAHLRWVRRGLRSGQAKLVAVYLTFLALVAGWAIGYVTANGPDLPSRYHNPPPVTAPPPGTRWVEVKTTGYCPCAKCCGKDADGFTSKNRDVKKHPFGIAVEPKIIPYWTRLSVPGYGDAVVDDTGGAMRQSARRGVVHIDLRFKDHKTARHWGVQWHWLAIPENTPAAQRGLGLEELLAYHGEVDGVEAP